MEKLFKIILGLITLLVMIVLGLGIYKFNFTNNDIYLENGKQINTYDGTYTINGQKITLENGISTTEAAPGSASKTVTRYFGNDVKGDFDKDGREDISFLLTQETGGSGIFYYVVARLNRINGIIGSEGLFLGDRIAPQNTELNNGNIIIVNYADRNPGEPITTQPSLGKSIWLKLDTKTMQFGEVVQNFEGEADPAKMTLNMKTWNWIKTTYKNGAEIKPNTGKSFTLTFKNDKTFSATTDCNSVGGEYIVNNSKITFDKMMTTLMYCEGSQENDFVKTLNETESYYFTSKGELVFELKTDDGLAVFR
jgi:heat shock protein HslJ